MTDLDSRRRRTLREHRRPAAPFAALAAALLLLSGAPDWSRVVAAAEGATDGADAPVSATSSEVERARAMIFSDPAAALGLLRPLAEGAPDDTDAWFFRGMAASAAAGLPAGGPGAPADDAARRALFDEAAASYRHILERRPGLAGARLELARVLFERGRCLEEPEDLLEHLLGDDCDAAAHHFRRALAGDLPPEIAEAVSRYLALTQARKRVSGSFGLSVAPDSNINAGPSAQRFASRLRNFFTGERLEFDLDERARADSGVGFVVSTSGEYRHPLPFRLLEDSATRLRLGAGLYRREYPGRRFDDMTLSLHAGPQALFPLGRVSLLAKADRRWFGGEIVGHGIGPRLEADARLGEQLWLSASAERIERHHRRNAATLDGPRSDLDLSLNFAATPSVLLGLRGGLQRVRPDGLSQRSRTRRVGGFASIDLPPVFGVSGFSLGLIHDVMFTRYDDQRHFIISLDKNRRDRTAIRRLIVSNDRLELFGFAPVLSLVQERRESNIDAIFEYRRNRAELSFRRLF